MTLTSQCACPGGCPEERHERPLSAGGVFLLVLVVGALFYLLVGVAFRRIVVGATGVEMIPNRRFWASLPGLVRVRERGREQGRGERVGRVWASLPGLVRIRERER